MRGGEQQLASTSVTGAKIMAAAAAEEAAVNLTILLSFPHRDAAAGLRMGAGGCTQGLWLTWIGTVTEDSWLQCQ